LPLSEEESVALPRQLLFVKMMGHIGQWENRFIAGGRQLVTNLLSARLFEHNLRKVYSYEILGY
jgi:hypothetical protein